MKIGFIGLGNVGGKLAGSLLRNGFSLEVNGLNPGTAQDLIEKGAGWAETPKELAESSDLIITCLLSPEAIREVMESKNGVLESFQKSSVWMEMSTTGEAEIRRLGEKVEQIGGTALEAPVSGGCPRAATGNISIFVGGQRAGFDRVYLALQGIGRKILHVGPLGSASALKVVTNYLASTHLAALGEALMVCKLTGIDLAKA